MQIAEALGKYHGACSSRWLEISVEPPADITSWDSSSWLRVWFLRYLEECREDDVRNEKCLDYELFELCWHVLYGDVPAQSNEPPYQYNRRLSQTEPVQKASEELKELRTVRFRQPRRGWLNVRVVFCIFQREVSGSNNNNEPFYSILSKF